jgi:hypothetical protein
MPANVVCLKWFQHSYSSKNFVKTCNCFKATFFSLFIHPSAAAAQLHNPLKLELPCVVSQLSTGAHLFLHLAIYSTCGRQYTCAVRWTIHKKYVLKNWHILYSSSTVVHKKTCFYLTHQSSLTITVVIDNVSCFRANDFPTMVSSNNMNSNSKSHNFQLSNSTRIKHHYLRQYHPNNIRT